MWPIIVKDSSPGTKGFVLAEVLITLLVVVFVLTASVSIYIMAHQWWAEIAPRIDAQKIARVALTSIIDGRIDPTADTYTVIPRTYGRRNGIAWATAMPDIPSASRINFRLDKPGETSNLRSFYIATDPATQLKAVYYLNSNGAAQMIRPTLGITNLQFEKYLGYNNAIKVTATVDKNVIGTRRQPYRVKVEYNEIAYLRSVASL